MTPSRYAFHACPHAYSISAIYQYTRLPSLFRRRAPLPLPPSQPTPFRSLICYPINNLPGARLVVCSFLSLLCLTFVPLLSVISRVVPYTSIALCTRSFQYHPFRRARRWCWPVLVLRWSCICIVRVSQLLVINRTHCFYLPSLLCSLSASFP